MHNLCWSIIFLMFLCAKLLFFFHVLFSIQFQEETEKYFICIHVYICSKSTIIQLRRGQNLEQNWMDFSALYVINFQKIAYCSLILPPTNQNESESIHCEHDQGLLNHLGKTFHNAEQDKVFPITIT